MSSLSPGPAEQGSVLTEPDLTTSEFQPTGRICFISAHLDDVALSCSHFVGQHPGTIVVTVFAGAPDGPAGMWDRVTTRQESARDALSVRHAEDAEALGALGATPVWLDLFDGQYGSQKRRDRQPIVAALNRALDALAVTTVVAPVGLFHPDHVAVSDACLQLGRERAESFHLYADMPYAQSFPEQLDDRIALLGPRVGELKAFEPVDPAVKERAVGAYVSQMRWVKSGLAGFEVSMTDCERYWRLT
jgi:LmbE family N-acetylglucosaminyl deacetylase